jgi:2-hydroxycyclohexanecarboxyl-CoA dehydrogenase
VDGRRAVVTGGAGAIGAAVVRALAGAGMRVVVCARTLDAASSVAEGGEAYAGDLADHSSTAEMARAVSAAGPVDALVNCAGWGEVEPFFETTPATWDTMLAVNLRAPIQLSHAFVPEMAERGWGRVVFIGSDAGRVGSRNEAVYSAAKGGVNAFAKSLAHEVARRGVTCNVVSPGPTDTPRLAAFREAYPEKLAPLLRRIPVGRVGTPDDVAAVAAFLCGDEAGYITGQVISVNGGLHMP